MNTFLRKGHYRDGSWVRLHNVTRNNRNIYTSFSSFTIPNAKCPVCGDSVFYFKSSYGSSVFFDELGPPWPKHPCTDNPGKYGNTHYCRGEKKEYEWEKQGWKPMWNLVQESEFSEWIMIRGESNNNKKEVFFWVEKTRIDLSKITSPVFFRGTADNNKDILEYWQDKEKHKRTSSVFNDEIGWQSFVVDKKLRENDNVLYDIVLNGGFNSEVQS